MAKTYVDIVKYLIKATLEVNGIVEKPDIVGAIFGQTEGLLGDELDLRELQKNGRIGRIEVDTTVRGGKCAGTITIPSSLDMVETSILGAALEIVDRVGPCEAKIAVQKIEDTRSLKRKQVLGRAKDLLRNMMSSEIPESKELSEMVRGDLKVAEVVSYGPDALPAGPELETSEEIIVVEGRADVINLLRNGIKNVVGIGGANVGKTIADLCRKKDTTVFLDGDRGGDIILKELLHATEIDFVARAPIGREVEELTRKEIIQSLRRKAPVDQAVSPTTPGAQNGEAREPREDRERRETREKRDRQRPVGFTPAERDAERSPERPAMQEPVRLQQPVRVAEARPAERQFERQAPVERDNSDRNAIFERASFERPAPMEVKREPEVQVDPEVAAKLRETLKSLEGTLKAKIVGSEGGVEEVAIRDIMASLEGSKGVSAIVLDGIITQRLLDLANEKGAKFVAGLRTGNITHRPAGLAIVLAE